MTAIHTDDGLALEARWTDATAPARGVVVLCHPHPLDGGTMTVPLMERVAGVMAGSGLHVLRFNFRGVGASEGKWSAGQGEALDVAAALAAATLAFPEETVSVAGWSFGATISLQWQADTGSEHAWVGIAPGITPYRDAHPPDTTALAPARRLVIAGDRDQFASIETLREYAAGFNAALEVVAGSDHFFYFREDAVGRIAARFLGGRPVSD